MAVKTRAARAADAVHVVLGDVGKLKVHHMRQSLDVESPGGDVGGHEHADFMRLEARKRLGARRLALVAVNGRGDDAVLVELLRKAVGGVLHARKDKHLVPVVLRDQVAQKLALSLFGDEIDLLVDAGVFLVARNLHRGRVLKEGLGKRPDLVVEGRRKHQRLALLRQQPDDFLDVVDKAHVEHPVGLVEHEELDEADVDRLLSEMVKKPARGGDQKVGAARKGLNLRLDVDPAEDKRRLERRVRGIGADVFINLGGKLARGRKNEGAHLAGLARTRGCKHAGDDGKRKGGGLAGAGLCGGQNIAPGEKLGDGPGLDGGGLGVAQVLNRLQNGGCKTKRGK